MRVFGVDDAKCQQEWACGTSCHGRAQRRSRHWLELRPGPAAERYRVIAFDRPGFGHSKRPRDRLWTAATQAELLHNTFASLGIERLIVLGHSWGALTALKLALRKTAAVRRLVLVSGYYFPTARIDVPIFATPAIPIIGDVMRYTVSALFARLTLNRVIKTMFSPQAVPPDFVRRMVRELMVRPSQIRMQRMQRS